MKKQLEAMLKAASWREDMLQELLDAYREGLGEPVRENPLFGMEAVEHLEKVAVPANHYGWITDLRTQALSHCFGVSRVLKLSSLEFARSFDLIEPGVRRIYTCNGLASLAVRSGSSRLSKMAYANYHQETLVRDGRDRLRVVRHSSIPFRFDAQGQVVEMFNLFQVGGSFRGRIFPVYASLVHHDNDASPDYFRQENEVMFGYIRRLLVKGLEFTPQQWRVMELLLTCDSIAEAGSRWNPRYPERGYESIKAHNKRLLDRARERFPYFDFREARDVALLFQDLLGAEGIAH